MLVRVDGGIRRNSCALEIGCGLGRIAFPLRYLLSADGRYEGFEICRNKVEFLEECPKYVLQLCGRDRAPSYIFPYPDDTFDLVIAASVFTQMLPDTTSHYFQEAARVLRPNGRCLFSFFLLDNYRPGQPRP
jgi:SAM-dependent methyltransferase